MRGSKKIYHRPYLPVSMGDARKRPFICRLAPFDSGFELEWFDHGDTGEHSLVYGRRGTEERMRLTLAGSSVRVDGLETDTNYEVYVECAETGFRSNLRLVRTGKLPEGTSVINYLHPEDTQYDFSGRFLCSPSIVKTESGRLVASMDLFGPKMAQNLTLLFASDDDGESWHYLTDLYPFYWGALFLHKGVLYMLGLTTEYGNLQITSSKDDGATWSDPVTLFYGSNVLCRYGGMHRAPMHFTSYGGRLYTSCEYGCWSMGSHLPMALSIDENDDLLVPENWTLSELLRFDGAWKEAAGKQGETIEGNIVEGPDGALYNLLRWRTGSFLRLKVNEKDPEAPLSFVSIDEAPVSNSMFRAIRADNRYLLITSRKTERAANYKCWSYRNVLSLYESRDLQTFSLVKDIVNYENEDAMKVGFQYPALHRDGDTLYVAIRSAFNHADNFHNSNYILFHKMKI